MRFKLLCICITRCQKELLKNFISSKLVRVLVTVPIKGALWNIYTIKATWISYWTLLSITWQTCVCDRGGVWLAHNACLLEPVSRSHTVTSLLPWTADTIQDCSVGWVERRRTWAPKKKKQRSFGIISYKVIDESRKGKQHYKDSPNIAAKKWWKSLYYAKLMVINLIYFVRDKFRDFVLKIFSLQFYYTTSFNLSQPQQCKSTYSNKCKFEDRKNYLLDERDLLWEAEISGPSRLSFQSLCPPLASYDKDPLQMLLSPLQQPIVSKNSICPRKNQKQIWKLPMRSQTYDHWITSSTIIAIPLCYRRLQATK